MYTTPLSSLISSLNTPSLPIRHHLYADDTQLFISFSPSDLLSAQSVLRQTIQAISEWMRSNCYLLIHQKWNSSSLDYHNNLQNSLKLLLFSQTTPLSLPLPPPATLVSYSTLIYPSSSISLLCPGIVFITFVISGDFDRLWTSIQRAPLQLHLSTLNLTTATRFTITYHTHK